MARNWMTQVENKQILLERGESEKLIQPVSLFSNRTTKGILAAIFYGTTSVGLTFFNKAVVSVWQFEATHFIILIQMIFTIGFLWVLSKKQLIELPPLESRLIKPMVPVSIFYVLNVVVALTALRSVNVPMYGALKRLTTVVTLIGEYLLLNKIPTQGVVISVLIITIGTLMAGIGDLTFDLYGYTFAILSCIAQSSYLIFLYKSGLETDLNSFGLLFYSSVLAIPYLMIIFWWENEFEFIQNYKYLYSFQFLICFFLSTIFGSILNYSMFFCTTVNSPLTTTVVGHLKNFGTIALGLILFGGIKLNFLNILGLLVNTFGGFFYSYVKWKQSKKKITT